MNSGKMVVLPAATATLVLALLACASATPQYASKALPISVTSATLAVRISARPTTPDSINVVVHLIPRSTLAVVQARVYPMTHGLTVTPGCVFRPLRPPRAVRSRGPPYPLPVAALCSVVAHASRRGRYSLEVRILDGVGRDLVAPIRTFVQIPYRTP